MLDLISPEYAELNKKLHETDHTYGVAGFVMSQEVTDLRDEFELETVLDYGCGKGTLADSLGRPPWFYEYDPCVPGKETPPASRVDLLVCKDVLEHIEPDKLSNVLNHIKSCTSKMALLVIACRPADKHLPDGRNTHLIIQDQRWWLEQLTKHDFRILNVNAPLGELKVLVTPVYEMGDVKAKSAVSDTIRMEQAFINCKKVPRFLRHQPRHDRRAALVSYGPSIKQTWHTLKAERRLWNSLVVSVSGAHDFLIERGVVPDIHIECDPREHKAFFTRNPHPDVDYWIASGCHPKLIDNLLDKGMKVALWHSFNSEEDMQIIHPETGCDPNGELITGGGSVGCRAVAVLYVAGYRSFSVYGMDCSFAEDGSQHAGPHTGKKQTEWPVRIGDRWFKSSGALVCTAQGFINFMRNLSRVSAMNNEPFIEGTTDRVELFLHGDGLLREMYIKNMELADAIPKEAA